MCGAGARDPVTGQWAAVGGSGRPWAADGMSSPPSPGHSVLLCSARSALCPAVSNLHHSSGNPFLGLEMEGSGSDEC